MEVFEEFRAALRGLEVSSLARRDLVELVADVGRTRAALDAVEARATAAVDALDDHGPAPAATIRSATRTSQRRADRTARRAAQLSSLPATTDALAQGRINAEHADALCRAAADTSADDVEGSVLLDEAERCPADLFAGRVRRWVEAWRREQDRESAEVEAEARQRRLRSQRRLAVFEADNGMTVIHGEFDPIDGAWLRRALEAEADRLYQADGGREGAGEVRSPGQRRADALIGLVGRAGGDVAGATTGGRATTPAVRNQLVVTATLDATGGITDGRIPGTGAIPPSMLELLACGSDLTGLLFSGDGRPLWMGRRVRLATDEQWLGLIARDGGCVGCGADPSRCEAHHVVAWSPPGRGPTDIDNLVLLCRHHHHQVHDLGWELVWGNGGWTLNPPGGWAAA